MNRTIVTADNNITAREVKEFAGTSSSPSLRSDVVAFLSMMLKVPRLIDFDNKTAYFRARIRQYDDQHPHYYKNLKWMFEVWVLGL